MKKLPDLPQSYCMMSCFMIQYEKEHVFGDASWGEFYRMLEYKMADHGGKMVKVPGTFPSSQQCSSCGKKEPKVKDLSVRRWKCASCGTIHDRDINAAINILKKGKEILAS